MKHEQQGVEKLSATQIGTNRTGRDATRHQIRKHTQPEVATGSRPVPPGASRKRSEPFFPGTGGSPRPKSTRTTTPATIQLRNDRLGTLVANLSASFQEAGSWDKFVTKTRGRSYLSPEVSRIPHPAAPLLDKWRTEGVPVQLESEPLDRSELDARIARGCHPSACDHAEFLREELSEFIESKFWAVLPYRLARELPNLVLSPAAVKDERDRKPRLLCDHSWYGVNASTLPHAPPEAMQFGGALARILRAIRRGNPRYGPIRISKHDVKDGFYRMHLRSQDAPKLAIVLPRYEQEEALVAIPLACTMGWTESPPTFTTMSETVADLANQRFKAAPRDCPAHRLSPIAEEGDDWTDTFEPIPRGEEDVTATNKLRRIAGLPAVPAERPETHERIPISNRSATKPAGGTDVFVDDFIQLGQGGPRRLKALRDHLLHAVDEVLDRPGADETERHEAISLKKLLKGDGSWATRKLVLGWIIDTVRQTIELPPHRKATLADLFEDLQNRKRVGRRAWQSILGKLRFVSLAIPGTAGLFSALQLALNRCNDHRVRIGRHLRANIRAFARLAADLCSRPTYLPEVVADDPHSVGATDAAKPGMGGIFYDAQGKPYVWRFPFPSTVQKKLVSFENPTGEITNSDLEQAAVLAQLKLQSETTGTWYATFLNRTDNTPTVGRFRKGAVSARSAASYLCQEASDQQPLSAATALATAPAASRAQFSADLGAALQVASAAHTRRTTQERRRVFEVWTEFCGTLGVRPSLEDVPGHGAKVAHLLVFAWRYRLTGRRGNRTSKEPVRADSVAAALLAVGEGISHLGQPDPRFGIYDRQRLDPVLSSFLKKCRDDDSPTSRAHPATVAMLERLPDVLDEDHPADGPLNSHVIDLCIVGFFWLMRPAEFCGPSSRNDDLQRTSRSEAFRLRDVHFTTADGEYCATEVSLNDVNALTSASLTFTDQKNSVRGERIGHRPTAHPRLCPVKSLFRLVKHLRTHSAPPTTPISAVYDGIGRPRFIKSEYVTNALRHSATQLLSHTGIDPANISARSLRPGGATALLCANVDATTIQLIGRWQSDAMIRYLRVQAAAYRENYAQHMLNHGSFTFRPSDLSTLGSSATPRELPQNVAVLLRPTTPPAAP